MIIAVKNFELIPQLRDRLFVLFLQLYLPENFRIWHVREYLPCSLQYEYNKAYLL